MAFELASALDGFVHRRPEQADSAALFRGFLQQQERPFDRGTAVGHFTASCWLVSADEQRILLTHHRKLNRWLQLGGHADGDSDLVAVALREAEEESGLSDLRCEDAIFDLDRHRIPARGREPEHWHYDVRFVIRCQGSEDFSVSDESHALAWRPVVELPDRPDIDPSPQRMARYWLARVG